MVGRGQASKVLRLVDHFEDASYIYIVTNFYENGDLCDYIQKNRGQGPLPKKAVQKIIYQLAKALNRLHDLKIAHCNIDSKNILVTSANGQEVFSELKVRLAGFSSAKKVNNNLPFNLKSRNKTPEFLAPEVLLNKEVGIANDIWSLGILIFCLLSFDIPFWNPDRIVNRWNIINKPFNLDSEARFKNMSHDLKHLLNGMLEKDPNERFTLH